MKDSSRGERSLLLTGLALIGMQGGVKRDMRMTAARAPVSSRPAKVKEVLLACCFRGKLRLKLD